MIPQDAGLVEEIVTDSVVIVGGKHLLITTSGFDLAETQKEVFLDAGILPGQVGVMAVSIPFSPPWPLNKFGEIPQIIIHRDGNPIPAILSAEKALFYGVNYVFGSVVIIAGNSVDEHLSVGVLALKKINYVIDIAKRHHKSIVTAIREPKESNIVARLIDRANQGLFDKGKRLIRNDDIEVIYQEYLYRESLHHLFEILEEKTPCSKPFVAYVVANEQSAILIQR